MLNGFKIGPRTHKNAPKMFLGYATHCQHGECENATREEKPFCPTHVLDHPYVQDIRLRLAKVQDEIKKAEDKSLFSAHSVLACEILRFVDLNGPHTTQMIAKQLDYPKEAVFNVVAYLGRRGDVVLERKRKGIYIVHIPG